jgi:hypothetical protein
MRPPPGTTKPGSAATEARLLNNDRLGSAIENSDTDADQARQRLDLFAGRCRQMVECINAGAVPFIWGIDCLYDAAVWSGLADDVGDDAIQAAMADAFMGARRP